jgi:hypothetical protein
VHPTVPIAPCPCSNWLIPVNPALSPAVDHGRWILIQWTRSIPSVSPRVLLKKPRTS